MNRQSRFNRKEEAAIWRNSEKHFGDNLGRTPLLNMLERMLPGARGKADTARILVEAQGGKDSIPTKEWEMAQSLISAKGKDFEFRKNDCEKDVRKRVEIEMQMLYALFEVDAPTPIIKHDGVSRIEIDSSLSVSELYDKLWEYLVPASGKCDTVQGEVIRITGRLSNEVYGNGGANWDHEYRKMLYSLLDYLKQGQSLSEPEAKDAEKACSDINSTKGCGCEKEVGTLQELAVKWVAMNCDPLSLGEVNYKR